MTPFGTRGAGDFAVALDGGLAAALPGLALAARLRTVGASLDATVAPRAEFRDALRMRLLAVATVQAAAPAVGTAAAAPSSSTRVLGLAATSRRRGTAVAAGAMASVVAVSGVAVAGSQSLPGDPFYGVKRATEALQLRAADGDLEKGTRHLDQAATRLREVRGLALGRDAVTDGPALGAGASSDNLALRAASSPIAAGSPLSASVADRVRTTLAEMDEQTRDGSVLLTSAARSTRAPGPLRALSRFATRQSAGLEQLLPALPARTQDRARISLALLAGVADTTDELLAIGACVVGCNPSLAAPVAPGAGSTSPGAAPCDCAQAPLPAPAPKVTTPPSEQDGPSPFDEPATKPQSEPEPEPTEEPTSRPSSSPQPSPSPSQGGLPLPPLPLPLPSLPSLPSLPPLPVPVPTLTLAPQAPLPVAPDTALAAVAPLTSDALPGTSGNSGTGPSSGTSPAPVPQLTPRP